MNVATIVFTYNRSYHTEQVLEALRRNTVLPQKLYLFQDGLGEGNKEEWEKTNRLICGVDWCDKEVIVSENNKGLAASIESGVNYAFKEHDAVIVLEDDCVPTVDFINFVQQCFVKYENDKRIYAVSGYAWPIELQSDKYDVYGCGRISSWGWGTWRDRWEIYEKDYEIARKMKKDKEASKNLALWGNDLEDTLINNVRGSNDSWAVFWALNVISHMGICINPYYSLIRNIGFDGSGVHCGRTERYDTEMMCEKKGDFFLPDLPEISNEVEKAFAPLFGNYTAVNDDSENEKESVLIYGLGNCFHKKEEELNERYHIRAFIDNRKKGYYAGKKIIKPKDIRAYAFDKILVEIKNIGECITVVQSLVKELEVFCGLILIDNFTEFEEIRAAEDGSLIIIWKKMQIKVASLDDYNNICKILLNRDYT